MIWKIEKEKEEEDEEEEEKEEDIFYRCREPVVGCGRK